MDPAVCLALAYLLEHGDMPLAQALRDCVPACQRAVEKSTAPSEAIIQRAIAKAHVLAPSPQINGVMLHLYLRYRYHATKCDHDTIQTSDMTIDVYQIVQLRPLDAHTREYFFDRGIILTQTVGPVKCNIYRATFKVCRMCGKDVSLKRCARCKIQYYCSEQCQAADWSVHKIVCGKIN